MKEELKKEFESKFIRPLTNDDILTTILTKSGFKVHNVVEEFWDVESILTHTDADIVISTDLNSGTKDLFFTNDKDRITVMNILVNTFNNKCSFQNDPEEVEYYSIIMEAQG